MLDERAMAKRRIGVEKRFWNWKHYLHVCIALALVLVLSVYDMKWNRRGMEGTIGFELSTFITLKS